MTNEEMKMKQRIENRKWRMVKPGIWFSLFTIYYLLFTAVGHAMIGLSTRFVDVTLERVEIGRIYNLRQMRQIPYIVRNRSDIPVDVVVEVRAPTEGNITPGYEPIPDPSWLKVIPNRIRMEANSQGFAEIVLQVPNDPRYEGRHYHAIIKAYTVNTGLFAASVESRFRFSTGPGPETLLQEAKQKAMTTLDFDITPSELLVEDVVPGKKMNLKKDYRRTIKVTNRAETPLNLKFNSVAWSQYPLPPGYEAAPDPSWLVFKATNVAIPSDTVVSLEPIIQIPKSEEHYGKKYAFLIKADIILGIDLEVYNRIYVRVKEKGE